MHFFWNHDKSFQHFIDTAAIASLIYRDMQMLIWCLGGGILRHKPFVFRNNAEQSMLSALNNNDWMNEWMNEWTNNRKNALKPRAFFAPNVKSVRRFSVCVDHLPLSCIVQTHNHIVSREYLFHFLDEMKNFCIFLQFFSHSFNW